MTQACDISNFKPFVTLKVSTDKKKLNFGVNLLFHVDGESSSYSTREQEMSIVKFAMDCSQLMWNANILDLIKIGTLPSPQNAQIFRTKQRYLRPRNAFSQLDDNKI